MFRSLLLLPALALTVSGSEPRMSWLDNGAIRLGVNLELGGAITWLSPSGSEANVINSKDWGRQVQMSFYGGPVPFVAGDKRPQKFWEGLGWNPIQAGDDFRHGSRVLEVRNDGHALYVKCIPMQWPLDDVPGECTFESWLELEGKSVRARGRLVNARADHTPYPARTQELPAVYANGPYHRIFSYTGDRPFTGAPLTEVEAKGPPAWTQWLATEGWSALLDDHDFGVGVWSPGCVACKGGFAGKPGAGGPADDPCGYLAPIRPEILDHHIAYDFEYRLMLGSVTGIRAQATLWRTQKPEWRFQSDRQGWTYQQAEDAGWPIDGELKVHWKSSDPALLSPLFFAKAGSTPAVTIEAAFKAEHPTAQLFWATLAEPKFNGARSVRFAVDGGGEYRTYEVPLPMAAGQALLQLRLDPADGGEGEVRLRAVRLHSE